MVKSGTVMYVNEGKRGNSDGVLTNPYAALTLTTIGGPVPLERDRPVTALEVDGKSVIIPTSRYQNGETPAPGDRVQIHGLFKKSICKRGQKHFGLFGSERILDGKVIETGTEEDVSIDSQDPYKIIFVKKRVYKVQTNIGDVACDSGIKTHEKGDDVEVRETLRRWSETPSYSLTD